MHSKIHQIGSISYNHRMGLGYHLHLIDVKHTTLTETNSSVGQVKKWETVYVRHGLELLPTDAVSSERDIEVLLFLERVVTGLSSEGGPTYDGNNGVEVQGYKPLVLTYDILLWPTPHPHSD